VAARFWSEGQRTFVNRGVSLIDFGCPNANFGSIFLDGIKRTSALFTACYSTSYFKDRLLVRALFAIICSGYYKPEVAKLARWDAGCRPTINTLKANLKRLAFFACYRVVAQVPAGFFGLRGEYHLPQSAWLYFPLAHSLSTPLNSKDSREW